MLAEDFGPEDFPTGEGKDEKPNDDRGNTDEDNTPKNDHIYSWDRPADGISAGARDFLASRNSFREFVRVRFDDVAFTHNDNEPLEGSRASNREPWHTVYYLVRGTDGKWHADGTVPSASAPRRTGTGNGTMAVPAAAAGAVTEGWTATFNAAMSNWAVVGTDSGAQGTATTGALYTSTNSRISFTITAGGTMFVNGDEFKFSTFKSSATGGKKNETKLGAIDAASGP